MEITAGYIDTIVESLHHDHHLAIKLLKASIHLPYVITDESFQHMITEAKLDTNAQEALNHIRKIYEDGSMLNLEPDGNKVDQSAIQTRLKAMIKTQEVKLEKERA